MANGNQRRSKKKKIIIFGGLGLLLVVVLLLVFFGGDKEKIISVQTEKVEKRDITQVVSATGKINPIEKVILRPEVNGEIVELPVEEGDRVRKGQLLLRIKPDIYIAQRNRARANFESAKSTLKVREATLSQVESEYERVKGLYEKRLASDSELEAAKSNYLQNQGSYEAQKSSVLQAEEGLKEAQENLAKTAMKSPIDGTISELNVEISERVLGSSFTQGTHLMTVADLSQMEATVDVDENDVVLISVGDTSNIEIDAFGDRQFLGAVSQIGNSAITTGLGSQDEVVNFEVKIKMLEVEGNIRPGMSCDADIETETKLDVFAVPIQSVTVRTDVPKQNGNGNNSDEETGDEPKKKRKGKKKKPKEVVFLVNENQANMVEVKTGISDDTYIEIVEGMDGDEDVVSGPYRAISKELEDSVKVRLKGEDKEGENDDEEN